MSTQDCNDFLNYLEGWMEGERPSRAEEHLRGCTNCRTLVEDLEDIRHAAGDIAADDAAPPELVWVSLRAHLEQEGLIRDGRRRGKSAERTWFGGIFAPLPRPALAGIYLAALIAVAFALIGPVNRRIDDYRWISSTQDSTKPLSAQLNTAEQDSLTAFQGSDPAVTASLHQNLAIVDNYIALCEKSVRDEPENEVARDYLYTAYQQKADLVAQITERGDIGR
jgi:hypothetical protein